MGEMGGWAKTNSLCAQISSTRLFSTSAHGLQPLSAHALVKLSVASAGSMPIGPARQLCFLELHLGHMAKVGVRHLGRDRENVFLFFCFFGITLWTSGKSGGATFRERLQKTFFLERPNCAGHACSVATYSSSEGTPGSCIFMRVRKEKKNVRYGKSGVRYMGEMGGWAKLKKTRLKCEIWEKWGATHGRNGWVGETQIP